MGTDKHNEPGASAKGELTLADISAVAGPEFAEWLCGVLGGDVPSQAAAQPAMLAEI